MKVKLLKRCMFLFIFLIICTNYCYAKEYKNKVYSINLPNYLHISEKAIEDNDMGVSSYEGNNKSIGISYNNIFSRKEPLTLKGRLIFISKMHSKKMIHTFKVKKINDYNIYAFSYNFSDNNVLSCSIATDNYLILIEFTNFDFSKSDFTSDECDSILNSLRINDTINNVKYNKKNYIIIEWNRILKFIIPIIIIVIIVIGILFIKRNKKK